MSAIRRKSAHVILVSVVLLLIQTLSVSSANQTMPGRFLDLTTAGGSPFKVYVSGPVDARRGILLVPGWLGLNSDMEALAEQFADAGYRAMAIDLYDGRIATNPQHARKLMEAVNQADANAKYVATLNALKAPGRKLATIGWSYGGSQALHATLSAPELVSATVMYYPFGELISDKARLSTMQGPVLIQVGDTDFSFTPEKVEQYKAALQYAGKKLVVKTYDVGHSFDNPESLNYDRCADEDAKRSTGKFLDLFLN